MRGISALPAIALLPAAAYAQTQPASAAARASAVTRLQSFFASTLGQAPAERLRLSNAALAGFDPFDASQLLIEIAAIGVIVRAQPVQESVRARYPSRSKASIERAMEVFPSTPWAMALSGAWHYEVVRRSSFGAMMLGASRQAGRQLFERAIAADSADTGLRLAYAISLLSEPSEPGAMGSARGALQQAASTDAPAAAPEAYRTLVRRHAEALYALVRTGDAGQVQSRVLDIY